MNAHYLTRVCLAYLLLLTACDHTPQNATFEFGFQLKGILSGIQSYEKRFKRLPHDDPISGYSWRAECYSQLHPSTGKNGLSDADKQYGEALFRKGNWQVAANSDFLEGKAGLNEPILAYVPTPNTTWWQIESGVYAESTLSGDTVALYMDGTIKVIKLSELIPDLLKRKHSRP